MNLSIESVAGIARDEARVLGRRLPAADRDDVEQEAALGGLLAFAKLDTRRPLKEQRAWVAKSCRNAGLSALRKRSVRAREIPCAEVLGHRGRGWEADPEAGADARRTLAQLGEVFEAAEVCAFSEAQSDVVRVRLGLGDLGGRVEAMAGSTSATHAARAVGKLVLLGEVMECRGVGAEVFAAVLKL